MIASHVIEHVPDLISFLQQCEALLNPAGVLPLVVPDKHYCFDYFSSSSSTGNVFNAYAGKRAPPSHGEIFDHFDNAAKRIGNITWSSDGMEGADALVHKCLRHKRTGHDRFLQQITIDVHCWRYTPASFRLLVSDLLNLV